MMDMLTRELVALANDPRAWFAVAGLGAITLHSIISYRLCPLIHNKANITPQAAREAVNARYAHSTRFLLLMLAGIAAALSGMAMIAMGTHPPIALGLIAGGVFLIQTEPLRLNIRDRQLRVVASQIEGPEAQASAVNRLRGEYSKLMLTNVALTAAVAIYLLAF